MCNVPPVEPFWRRRPATNCSSVPAARCCAVRTTRRCRMLRSESDWMMAVEAWLAIGMGLETECTRRIRPSQAVRTRRGGTRMTL